MAAAIGRFQGQAGALGNQISTLKGKSADLVDQLRTVDGEARAAADTLMRYRRTVEEGKVVPAEDLERVPLMKQFIIDRAASRGRTDLGRAFVQEFERELGGRSEAHGLPPQGAKLPPGAPAPSVAAPSADHGPRSLTAQERTEYLRSGDYTAEQLDRARMLKPGTMFIRPAATAPPTGDIVTGAREAQGPGVPPPQADDSVAQPGAPAGAPAGGSGSATAIGLSPEQRAAQQEQADALQRRETLQRAAGLTERGLRIEWQDSTKALREQARELDRAEEAQRKLQRLKANDIQLSKRERQQLAALPETIQERRKGYRAERVRREALIEEAQRRGYDVHGDRLFAPDRRPGPVQQAVGAFAGGMGIGSGSIGGTVLGGLTGMLSPTNAIMSIAGLGLGKAWNLGKEAYGTEMRYLSSTLPMSRATGMSAQEYMRAGVSEADQYKVFELPDLFQARHTLQRGTGRSDTASSILPVASVTGQTASEEAQRIAAMGRLAPRFNPYLSGDLLRAYGASALARPQAEGPGRLPFETAMYPQFAEQVGRLAQSQSTPFTRVPIEGVAEQLGAATGLRLPGIDMSTSGGLDVASHLVQGLNQMTSGGSDAFGDMQMMGLLRLRGTPAAARLKEKLGIDLGTPIGLLRAQSRAPQLAASGHPEVQQVMFGAMKEFMPDDDTRALALTLGDRKMDPEAAYQLTRPGVDSIIGARGGGRRGPGPWRVSDADIDTAANEMAGRPDVDQFYQWNVRPDSTMLTAGLDNEGIGRVITEGMNDLRDTVRQVLTELLSAPVAEPLALVNPPQPFGGLMSEAR